MTIESTHCNTIIEKLLSENCDQPIYLLEIDGLSPWGKYKKWSGNHNSKELLGEIKKQLNSGKNAIAFIRTGDYIKFFYDQWRDGLIDSGLRDDLILAYKDNHWINVFDDREVRRFPSDINNKYLNKK